jgi:hypothetical protein
VKGTLVLLGCFTVLAPTAGYSETIYLTDGSRLSGHVTNATADSVRFETPDGSLMVARHRIQRIDYATPPAESSPGISSSRLETTQERPMVEHTAIVASQHTESIPSGRTSAFFEGGYGFESDDARGSASGDFGLLDPASPNLFVGGSVGVSRFNNKVNALSKGTVTLFPVLGRILMRAPNGFSLSGGAGYVFASYSMDSDVTSALAYLGFADEEKIKGAFGGEVALGYTGMVGGRPSLGGFIGYRFHEPRMQAKVTNLSTDTWVTVKGDTSFSSPFLRLFFAF